MHSHRSSPHDFYYEWCDWRISLISGHWQLRMFLSIDSIMIQKCQGNALSGYCNNFFLSCSCLSINQRDLNPSHADQLPCDMRSSNSNCAIMQWISVPSLLHLQYPKECSLIHIYQELTAIGAKLWLDDILTMESLDIWSWRGGRKLSQSRNYCCSQAFHPLFLLPISTNQHLEHITKQKLVVFVSKSRLIIPSDDNDNPIISVYFNFSWHKGWKRSTARWVIFCWPLSDIGSRREEKVKGKACENERLCDLEHWLP